MFDWPAAIKSSPTHASCTVFITVVAMANSMVYWASDPLILGNLIEIFPALSIVEELAYLCFPSRKVTEIVFPDEDF